MRKLVNFSRFALGPSVESVAMTLFTREVKRGSGYVTTKLEGLYIILIFFNIPKLLGSD